MVDAGEIRNVLRTVLFSHPNTTVETDLVLHTNQTELITHHFDFSGFTGDVIIRAKEKIDAITFRQLSAKTFPTDFEAGTDAVIIILDGAGQDMSITLETPVAEGAPVDIEGTVRDEIRL